MSLSDPAADPAANSGLAQLAAGAARSSGWLAFLDGEAETAGEFVADTRFGAMASPAAPPAPDDQQMQIAEAFERGLAQGRAESLAAAQQDTGERRKLGIALRALESDQRDAFAAMLAETVKTLCEASFAPIALDLQMLQDRCLRAATMLEEAQDAITLRLCPADIARLDPEFAANWTIAPDPDLAQGELRAEGRDGAVLDGPREWSRALAEALREC